MIGIFWLAFYLPLKFYPFKGRVQAKNIFRIEYFVAIFYALNPFIYERFISGQWRVVVGYLSVLPLISSLIKFHQQNSWKQASNIFLILLLTGFFSIHFLIINGLIIFFYIICRLITSLTTWLKQQIILNNKTNCSWNRTTRLCSCCVGKYRDNVNCYSRISYISIQKGIGKRLCYGYA